MKRIIYLLAVSVLLTAVMISCKTKVTDVQLNKTVLNLKTGDTETLIATVLPVDAKNKTVSWKSDNFAVATIDNNGKVTAKTVGTAVVTVTTDDGNKTATCTITVTKEEPPEPIEEPEMIFVEGGTFMYGFTDEEWKEFGGEEWSEEAKEWLNYPQVQMTVKSFYISKYPVTQKLWKQVMGSLPNELISYGVVGDNYPVCYVPFGASMFTIKLSELTGKNYSIPSGVEWEYAARGGNKSKGYKYSGSNNLNEVAWHAGNSNGSTHPVGEKQPNELGIYDMTGNVSEWVCAGFLQKSGIDIIRGGSWRSGWNGCYVPYTVMTISNTRVGYIGFRLVLYISEP